MSGESRPRLSARGVTVRYGTVEALHGADLEVFDGESVAITGPSGSGKSTLLHALTGVIAPDAGQVLLRSGSVDEDVTSMNADERAALRLKEVGFVFQHGLLLPELTVVENVALPLLLDRVEPDEARRRAQEQLARVGLERLEDRRIGQLSGGQVQRVAVARATVTHASVIAADEPTGSLDSANSRAVMSLLVDLTEGARESCLLVVTHDERVAARCTRRVHVLDGRLLSQEEAA